MRTAFYLLFRKTNHSFTNCREGQNMTQILAQQEFLPTDLVRPLEFWAYGIPGAFIVIGLIVILIATYSRNGGVFRAVGALSTACGAFMMLCSISIESVPEYSKNYENLKSNIQSVYNVDSIELLSSSVENGGRIKIQSDEYLYEVFVSWDEETYKPTLSPTNISVEDIENLRK